MSHYPSKIQISLKVKLSNIWSCVRWIGKRSSIFWFWSEWSIFLFRWEEAFYNLFIREVIKWKIKGLYWRTILTQYICLMIKKEIMRGLVSKNALTSNFGWHDHYYWLFDYFSFKVTNELRRGGMFKVEKTYLIDINSHPKQQQAFKTRLQQDYQDIRRTIQRAEIYDMWVLWLSEHTHYENERRHNFYLWQKQIEINKKKINKQMRRARKKMKIIERK